MEVGIRVTYFLYKNLKNVDQYKYISAIELVSSYTRVSTVQVILKMKSRNLRKKLGNLGISEKNVGNLGNYLTSEARFYNLLEVRRADNERGPKGLDET